MKLELAIYFPRLFYFDHLSFLLSPFLKKKKQLSNNLGSKEFNCVKKKVLKIKLKIIKRITTSIHNDLLENA
jgi:hypothetical protein